MVTLNIETPRVFLPLLEPARYKGAHGGRGSAKSHHFASAMVEDSILNKGQRSVCIREIQKSLKDSAKRLIEDKIQAFGSPGFRIFHDRIQTPGDGVILFNGMADHSAESIKSLEGFDRAWIEEAQTLSKRSLTLLRPTIRKEGSEIWASWNPRRRIDPIDEFLRGPNAPKNSIVVESNWSDNPFFPEVLELERLHDLEFYPDEYDHVWEGGYATVNSGAYFAASMTKAKAENRIGRVAADPLMTTRAFWDIGGTGSKADACAIWIAQFIGKEIRVLDYYEAIGQELGVHITWLRDNGYGDALQVLPHDGKKHDMVYNVTYESALKDAGFKVETIPNQGAGAAMARVDAVRRVFPQIWFNADTTEAGRDALGWYHEKKDEARDIGLGPNHDWSSHGADAFGLMAVAHKKMSKPRIIRPTRQRTVCIP